MDEGSVFICSWKFLGIELRGNVYLVLRDLRLLKLES